MAQTPQANWPVVAYLGGMNEKGNRYAIHALKDRRAMMAGEIVQMKEGISYREEQLSHLDAVLRELDPSYRADSIPPKKLRRVELFGNGEVGPAHCGRAQAGREAAGEQRHCRGHRDGKGVRPAVHPCPDAADAGEPVLPAPEQAGR
jgi:hypothetical protein